jgi:hypothetical protein
MHYSTHKVLRENSWHISWGHISFVKIPPEKWRDITPLGIRSVPLLRNRLKNPSLICLGNNLRKKPWCQRGASPHPSFPSFLTTDWNGVFHGTSLEAGVWVVKLCNLHLFKIGTRVLTLSKAPSLSGVCAGDPGLHSWVSHQGPLTGVPYP